MIRSIYTLHRTLHHITRIIEKTTKTEIAIVCLNTSCAIKYLFNKVIA